MTDRPIKQSLNIMQRERRIDREVNRQTDTQTDNVEQTRGKQISRQTHTYTEGGSHTYINTWIHTD